MTGPDAVVGAVQDAVAELLSDVNTSMPGEVLSYDPQTRRAVVRPSLSKQIADGRVLAAPQIASVPVVFPTAGGATITMPVKPGDGVMLHFSQRSLEAWQGDGDAVPDDPRQFDLSDAIAIPGLTHIAATQAAHPENMVISFGAASIQITPAGQMIFAATSIAFVGPEGGAATVATFDASQIVFNGVVSAPAHPITSMGVSVPTHEHSGVYAGSGVSGPPITGT